MTNILSTHAPEDVYVKLPDGEVVSMNLAEAAKKDVPEGIITVTVSATLLHHLMFTLEETPEGFPWPMKER